jgi:DNA polymerase III delta prime subunit
MTQILSKVASKEGVAVDDQIVERIAKQSHGNLRKALLMLEAGHVQK